MTRLTAVFALMLFGCEPAVAQDLPKTFCLARKIMLSTLVEGGRQHLVGQGTTPKGELIEVYSSEDNWSLIVTHPQSGVSCAMGAGRSAWETIKEPKT